MMRKQYFEVDHSHVTTEFTWFGIIISFTVGFIIGVTAFCFIHDIIMWM